MTELSKDPARLHEALMDMHTSVDDPATKALLLSLANYVWRTWQIERASGPRMLAVALVGATAFWVVVAAVLIAVL